MEAKTLTLEKKRPAFGWRFFLILDKLKVYRKQELDAAASSGLVLWTVPNGCSGGE
jgi:hypothetical protein